MARDSLSSQEALRDGDGHSVHDSNSNENFHKDTEVSAQRVQANPDDAVQESEEQVSTSVDRPSLTSSTSGEGLRRKSGKSGKIANLRAAFESTDGPKKLPSPGSTQRKLDRSQGWNRDQDAAMVQAREQHSRDIAKMKEEHETVIVLAKEQHQAEIEILKDQLAKEIEMRNQYEERCTSLEDDIEELQLQLSNQITDSQTELTRQSNETSKALEEATVTQRQLVELKRNISAATRIENQVSDSTFSQEFQNLYHETQNWVVNNFRRFKVEKSPEVMVARLESIAEPKQLDHLRPIYSTFDQANKIAALQATVVCYMMEIWEEPLLFGMPSQQDWRKSLRKAVETLPTVLPAVSFNRWRSITLDALRQSDSIRGSVDSAVASLSEMICITLNTLADAESSEAQHASLGAIVKRAVTLSHLFKVQRAQYEFRLPSSGDVFVATTMEDVSIDGDSDGELADKRAVFCATSPSIVKMGDDSGDNIEIFNVVVKAKVICKG